MPGTTRRMPRPARIAAVIAALSVAAGAVVGAAGQPPRPPGLLPPPPPQQRQPPQGPWANDVHVYRIARDGQVRRLATFERAGVPTVARLKDGRLLAAHQHFPEGGGEDFDKVAVRFSSDEGATWTAARVMTLTGLPAGLRFPFDPTLVALPDGRVRCYFTSVKGRRIDLERPGIYSAVSTNGVDYVVEPGVRFRVNRRPVIDCAVALHRGVFHLYSPDNGSAAAASNPGANPRDLPESARPREGVAYHATSADGLTFTRRDDVRLEGAGRRWLGCAYSDGNVLRFFGTRDPSGGGGDGPGLWTATSADGQGWKPGPDLPRLPGADPGVVPLRDGSWLLVATGPPVSGRRREPPRPHGDDAPPPPPPIR